MITPEYVREMAAYNAWQNDSLYRAADALSDADRQQDRGAFFGSIQATLAHVLWGDTIWMSRFDNWQPPEASLEAARGQGVEWATLKRERAEADRRISAWARRVGAADLDGELSWFSVALGRELTRPRALLVMQLFNHQTHHRGQVHAMLTAAGAQPDDTDLPFRPGL